MTVKANGININYQVDGPERAPWLIFSNSLATSLAMWDEQAVALKDRFRVLRYDQRGHGGTEAPADRYAFDTLLDDALALMDALGIAKATFAGLSMGGATALGLAERHPDRLALAAHDYASAVATVKCPTLFIVGEKDGATPSAMAKLHEKLHDKLAGSRFVTLPGAGHISNMDRAGEFNSALRDFLAP